ncbi:MAG: hypothetical protein ACREJB_14320 [Planctomycetaceae bacterium]
MITATYIAYLTLSLFITVYVAHTLHKNGRVFLVECFGGNERVADAVNHLLVVGFYLVNMAFVMLALRTAGTPRDLAAAMELLGTKVGTVLLTLGLMHLFNLAVFTAIRRRRLSAPLEIVDFLD